MKAAALTSALGLERAPFAALLAELGLGAYTEEVHAKALAGLGRHPELLADLAGRAWRVEQEARRGGAPESRAEGAAGGEGAQGKAQESAGP